jgi:hypothetical protein
MSLKAETGGVGKYLAVMKNGKFVEYKKIKIKKYN